MFYGAFDGPGAGTMRRRTLVGFTVLAVLLAVVAVISQSQKQKVSVLLGEERWIDRKIYRDEVTLQHDLAFKRQMQMQTLATYPDGCKCDTRNCLTPNCDEENSDGPLCKCPGEKTKSMPGAATPWPLDAKFRSRSSPSLRQLSLPVHYVPQQSRETRSPWNARGAAPSSSRNGVVMPPGLEEFQSAPNMPPYLAAHRRAIVDRYQRSDALTQSANAHRYGDGQWKHSFARNDNSLARMQQKWIGSPPKFLPPNGDYPGGSTGIPEDGYLAYETGWSNDGPFHGELAPMQEAGIASKSQRQQLLHRMNDDELVPARAINPDLFAGSRAGGPTLNAFSSLF